MGLFQIGLALKQRYGEGRESGSPLSLPFNRSLKGSPQRVDIDLPSGWVGEDEITFQRPYV
jgi:hypothetical protein